MKIEYLSCDGETEVEEEILSAEFVKGMNWNTYELAPMLWCKRPDGTDFEVDYEKVYRIRA